MASSGSYDFSVNRDQIIKHAYQEIGALEEGESPDADQIVQAAEKLTMMAKTLAKKHNLHLLQDVVLFLVAGQQSYSLGSASTDAEWCAWDDFNQMEVATAALDGASTLVVDDASDFTNSDRVVVVQDDGTVLATTATKSSNTLTLGTALTDDVADGNVVFSYTSRVVRPLRIVKDTIYRRDASGNDLPVTLIGKSEYDMLTSKTQSGKIIQVAYQPFLTSGRLWVWQCADLATDVLRFTIERPVQDFDSTTDTPDFPVEASLMLIKGLARLLAGPNDASEEIPRLTAEYEYELNEWLDGDRENAPVRFQPDIRR